MSGSTSVDDHIVYLALRPEPAAAEAAVRLAESVRRKHGLGGRPIPAGRLHVSLVSLGVFRATPAQTLAKAEQAMSGLAGPPFRLAFNRVATFGRGDGPRPFVLRGDDGVIGAEMLQATLQAALAAPGLVSRRGRPFEPHMTLLWDADGVEETYVEPVTWTVREVVLIDSLFGAGRHEVLGRWPLG